MLLLNGIIDFDNILLSIVNWVYSMICQLYTSFLIIARVNLFKNNGAMLTGIVHRVYYMVGVAMLFVLAYSLLRQIVNPEQKDSKSGFKLVIGIVKAVIVIAITPTVFTMAFDVQEAIFNKNTIGKIIIGTNGSGNGNQSSMSKYISSNPQKAIEKGGNTIAVTIYRTFFRPYRQTCDSESDVIDEATGQSPYEACIEEYQPNGVSDTFGNMVTYVTEYGNFDKFNEYRTAGVINDNSGGKTEYINFNPIFSLLCGGFCIYMLLSFCISLAIRIFKLAAYEILAPVAALLDVTPGNNGSLSKWIKVCATTFAEAMIRVAVLFFVVYIVNIINNSNLLSTISISRGLSGLKLLNVNIHSNLLLLLYKSDSKNIVQTFLILGVILFGKQVPQLISDVTGIDSKNMSMGLKDQLKNAGVFTAAGVAGGAAISGARGVVRGAGKGVTSYKKNKKSLEGLTGTELANAKKNNRKAGAKAVGMGALGFLTSGIAGTVSGGVHGFDKDSSSLSSIGKAAKKGYDTASANATKRATYKGIHGGTVGGAIAGRLGDLGRGALDFLGIGGVESLEKENEVLTKIVTAKDNMKSKTFSIIESELKKGESFLDARDKLGYDARDAGSTYSQNADNVATKFNALKALDVAIAQAEVSGKAELDGAAFKITDPTTGATRQMTVSEARQQRGADLKALADVLQQSFALMSKEQWEGLRAYNNGSAREALVKMGEIREIRDELVSAVKDGMASSKLVQAIQDGKKTAGVVLTPEAIEAGAAHQKAVLDELELSVSEITQANREAIAKYNKDRERSGKE